MTVKIKNDVFLYISDFLVLAQFIFKYFFLPAFCLNLLTNTFVKKRIRKAKLKIRDFCSFRRGYCRVSLDHVIFLFSFQVAYFSHGSHQMNGKSRYLTFLVYSSYPGSSL